MATDDTGMTNRAARAPLSQITDRLRSTAATTTGDSPLSVGQLLAALGDDAHLLLIVLMCVPFLMPFPSMGLSAPAGIIVVLVGLAIAVGIRPRLPASVLRRRISAGFASRCAAALEKLLCNRYVGLRSRLGFAARGPMRCALGCSLAVAGLVLGLPLPLPFSNAVPALAIILLCLGLLASDGLAILLGHAACAATCVGLFLIGDLVWRLGHRAVQWLAMLG